MNLFKQGVVAPLWIWRNNPGRLNWSFLLFPLVQTPGKALSPGLSSCSIYSLPVSSQQHIYHFIWTRTSFLNLSRLWGRPTTGADKTTNKHHLQMGGICVSVVRVIIMCVCLWAIIALKVNVCSVCASLVPCSCLLVTHCHSVQSFNEDESTFPILTARSRENRISCLRSVGCSDVLHCIILLNAPFCHINRKWVIE